MNKSSNILTLFRQWLSGDMRQAEEKRLDQLAAEDPFLAEAMEGYQGFPEGDHLRDVTRLKANLRKKYQKDKRKGAFYIYRIAAAVAVLIVALGGFWWVNQGGIVASNLAVKDAREAEEARPDLRKLDADRAAPEKPSVAVEVPDDESLFAKEDSKLKEIEAAGQKIKKSKVIAPPPINNQVAVPQREEVQQLSEITALEPAPNPEPDEPEVIPTAPRTLEPQSDEGLAIENEEDATLDTVNPGIIEQSKAANRNKRLQKESVPEMAAAQPNSNPRMITGVVKDDNGEALIGANILVVGQSTGTITDFDGKFELAVPEGTERLVVNYVGFQNKEIELEDQNELIVILDQSDIALNEVTVTGFGVSEKEEPAASFARPKEGYKDFKRYIEDNLRYPEEAISNGIEGKVKLRFKVYANGKLGDFEVLRTLGYGCDQEAIRLLKDGPRWEISGNKFPLKKTYVVKFDLP